jgi:hypothetical protein
MVRADVKKQTVTTREGMRTRRTPRTLMIASEQPIKFIQSMPPLTELQSIDHYLMALQGICGRFGGQPISLAFGAREKGTSVAPYLRLEVQNRSVKEIQMDKEDIFNTFLFPAFGVTDWLFKFNDVERKDERREAEIAHTKAVTLEILRSQGFDVTYDEFGKLVIPPKPTLKANLRSRHSGQTRQKPKVSDASEREILGTTTERFPHGPRGEPD